MRWVLAVALSALVGAQAMAAEIVDRPKWMGADKIADYDKKAALDSGPLAQLLNPYVASDEDIVPGVLWLGPGRGNALAVRFASEEPCGRFSYSFFGAVADRKRTKQVSLCGDDLLLVHRPGQRFPDVQITTKDGMKRIGVTNDVWGDR
jgi:hypothetical protein